jgi:DNA-damage-inducible protein D
MRNKQLPVHGKKTFDALKLTNEHGAEYWSARDLQPLLGYTQWRCFEQAIERTVASCENAGNTAANHFAGAGKIVDLGPGSQREVKRKDK